jgi:hypothetical protein
MDIYNDSICGVGGNLKKNKESSGYEIYGPLIVVIFICLVFFFAAKSDPNFDFSIRKFKDLSLYGIFTICVISLPFYIIRDILAWRRKKSILEHIRSRKHN